MNKKKYFSRFLLVILNLPILIWPLKAEVQNLSNEMTIEEEIPKTQIYNSDEYIVDIGDVLDIKIFDSPEDSGDYTILNDGTVNIGLIGRKYVAGKTIKESTLYIRNFLSKELLRPYRYIQWK